MFKLMFVIKGQAIQFGSYASLKSALTSGFLLDFDAWYVIG